MSLESDIQRDIIQYLHGRKDTYVLNVGGGASTARGTSDLLVCYKGRFVALEVKRPDGGYGLTKPQAMRQAQIRKAGGTAEVVASIEDVTALLSSLDKGGRV
jgi:hypothetical protein